MFEFLDKSHSVARPGYSRWLVPPAAMCVSLSIGQVYGWSVFNKPLQKLIGIKEATTGDWSESAVVVIFSIAIAFLGLSAAFGGKWLERVGPRKAMFLAACCFGSGFFVAALGVQLHQIALVYLGYGVIGGIGLGIGYIAPVSTLIRWFPDRPGMATGMAIMGFGGGAMIGAPLGTQFMERFKSDTSVGVVETFMVMGSIYFVFMMIGTFTIRITPPGWKPAGWTPSAKANAMVTTANVHVDNVLKTPQFYLLWLILCLNVTAGISILAKASDMIQDIFGAGFTPTDAKLSAEEAARLAKLAAVAAGTGFVGLLSLPNMAGRFLWSFISDYIGRKWTYAIYFALGATLYLLLPTVRQTLGLPGFVTVCVILLSMYGGGFSTMPAYIRDLYGSMHVSAILGRVLTAWSVAGILGPILVTKLVEMRKDAGVAPELRYDPTMYLMAGLLAAGLVCDLLMRPVSAQYHHHEEAAHGQPVAATK